MAENLPLIPRKGAVCADVRPVLREVFREDDFLPPLTTERNQRILDNDSDQPRQGDWINKYSNECKEIWMRENKIKHDHARRLSKKPLPNIYQLSSPVSASDVSSWRQKHGIISRKDLVPSIEQDAGRDGSLWIQNVLNRSSCDVSCMEVRGSHVYLPLQLAPADEGTVQSLSIGELVKRPPPPPPPVPPPPLLPEYIVCVPPQLDFVNFTVGNLHTQSLRLVNISKFEIRLSLRPPTRRELDVVLMGARGLTVSSGATAEFRVRFRPRDVRAMRDALHVRVSVGRSVVVPVHCYMQPPILDVLVPNVTWSSLSCSPGSSSVRSGGDVLELGARLLGDVHCARMLLHCDAEHAAFFILTEDAWISFCLDTLTRDGALIAGPFTISPAWWRGGGAVRGTVWCRAPHAGLHVTAMRILASTAVARPLHILADALHFTPDHVTLEAQDKDYDICSEDDPDCKYYVHLGTAFPNRGLSATVKLVNHSPVIYSYYWSVRPWGICSCWEEEMEAGGSVQSGEGSNRLCIGALEAKAHEHNKDSTRAVAVTTAHLTRVEPTRGRVAPRSLCTVHVCVPDVGERLGTQRAVLMLIMKDIPKESFPPDYDPVVVKTETVLSDTIPGQEPWSREVCEVVCCQLEVWWEVVPVRFVLDPPILPLPHSRRVKEVELTVRATQLYGSEGVCAEWGVPPRVPPPPCPQRLTPAHSTPAQLTVPLPILPNEYPSVDVFVLEAANEEWSSKSRIIRQCATRHPQLRPARAWLGVVAPGTHMNTQLQVLNDTHQHICWWATPFRWHGENEPSAWCRDRQVCDHCHERACSCALLKPSRGALPHMNAARIVYDINAPEIDGCVATLVQVRRTLGDVAQMPNGAGCEARASVVAYRVVAPRLVLRALPCHGDRKPDECEGCNLDTGVRQAGGTAVLRPSQALALGRCTCYRLRFTNITPLPTTVNWEQPIEKEDVLKVTFLPNDFDVGSYARIEIRVVIEAQKVCRRRIFVYRARVARAYQPVYLLIDTAVAGLEVTFEMPLGGEEVTSAAVIMRRSQKEEFPSDVAPERVLTPEEMFVEEDRKRAERANNTCHCQFKIVYTPPVKPLRPSEEGEKKPSDIEILWEPPPLTRVCGCDKNTKPVLPDYPEPFCLQFKKMPLRTVRSRRIKVTNVSVKTTRWSATVRNWPRRRNRTLTADAWAPDVQDSGVCVEVAPTSGVLGAHAQLDLTVSVYADCWGLYRDQILINIEKLEPIVIDLWVEAVGPPLQFAMNPQDKESASTLWMSSSDPERVVRLRNTSRTDLLVHAYVLHEHEHSQDVLPFRMYLRFFDVLPRMCPCVTAFDSAEFLGEDSGDRSSTESGSEVPEEMDTGIEVFFTADYGLQQEDTEFKVEPAVFTVLTGASSDLRVSLIASEHGKLAPNAVLLLRALPMTVAGPGWYRPEQLPQTLRLRQAERQGVLRASSCRVRVKCCALDLPMGDVMRVRKLFSIQNIGNGPLTITASTEDPWSILQDVHVSSCDPDCGCAQPQGDREAKVPLYLLPRSLTELVVEVCINTAEVWPPSFGTSPCAPIEYPPWRRTATPLRFHDEDNVLLTVPLILELEYPILHLEPTAINFGFVTDGDTRKSYFTVSHSSREVTLDLMTEWLGGKEFVLWPKRLQLAPGASERVYVQYTARWRGGPVEGWARVAYAPGAGGAGAGGWCRAALPCRASPARDFKCHATLHDHTDDPKLLPPELAFM